MPMCSSFFINGYLCGSRLKLFGYSFSFQATNHAVAYTAATMITVTDKTKDRIIELRQKGGFSYEHYIRVSVKSVGYSELMYHLIIDDLIQAAAQIFEDKGIRFLINM